MQIHVICVRYIRMVHACVYVWMDGDVYMCVRVCPAGVWGVDIHSLCHRTFIERLLHICPVLSTGANEKWCLGRGKTRGGGGPVGRGVVGRRPGWCWEVWLQGECEHPRHTAGWRLPGATRQPCRKRWAVCILRLRKPRPEESESPAQGHSGSRWWRWDRAQAT